MSRVSDFGQSQLTLYYLASTQKRLFDTQNTVSTGKVAPDFAGLGADSSRFVNLQASVARVDQYLKNAQIVDQRLAQMETINGQVFTIASNFKTLLVNGLNANQAADLDLGQKAQDMLTQISGLLNSQLDGRYLFSGTATDTAPVDVNAAGFVTPPGVYPGTADTGYYQGNATKLSARLDESFDLSYGVTADNAGYEQLIRALRLAADATLAPQDQNRLDEALRVVNDAIQAIPNITGQIGSARAVIESIGNKHTDFKQFADKAVGDLANVDVARAVTLLTQDQTTLEASYQVVARLSQLSLSNFL